MKISYKKKKKIDGAISLFMVIILLPTMLLSGLMVDLARFNMAKSMISSAGDLTMNAALADYDGTLQDVYGLFAISQNDDDLYKNLSEYFQKTLVSNKIVDEGESEDYVKGLLGELEEYLYLGEDSEAHITNLFDMDVKTEAAVSGAEGSTLEQSRVLKKQIVEYMKYRAPINLALGFFSGFGGFTKAESQSAVVEKKVEAEAYVSKVGNAAEDLYKKIKLYDAALFNSKIYNETFAETGRSVSDPEPAKNDSEELKFILNRDNEGKGGWDEVVLHDTVYNYKKINQYVLGFSMDDKQTDITNGGHAVSIDYSLLNTSVNIGSTAVTSLTEVAAETAANTLINDYNTYITQISYMRDDTRYESLYNEVQSFMTENGITEMHGDEAKNQKKAAINTEVKDSLETALPAYKKLFAFMKKANEEHSAAKDLIEKYQTLLKYKYIAEKSYEVVNTKFKEADTKITENTSSIDTKRERNTAIDKELYGDPEKGTKGLHTQLKEAEEEEKEAIQTQIDQLEAEQEKLPDEIDQLEEENKKLGKVKAKLENGIITAKGASGALSSYVDATETMAGYYSTSTQQEHGSVTIDRLDDIYLCYSWYLECAMTYGDKLVKGVYDEAQYVYNKVESLTKLSKDVCTAITTLKSKVNTYENKLDTWKKANTSYSKDKKGDAAGKDDEFAVSNAKEIEAAEKTYDMEQIQAVYDYIEPQYSAILIIKNYISNPNSEGYKYGDKFFWHMDELREAKQAVQATAGSEFKNKENVTLTEIDNYYSNLCKNYTFVEASSKMRSFMKDDRGGEALLPFVGYLEATYPDTPSKSMEKTTIETDEGDKDAKGLYESMEEDLKSDKDLADEDVKSKYGYTYAESGKETPSKKEGSGGISTAVNSDEAETEFSSKKKSSSSFFDKVKKYLTTGRDNLYVMEYIFGNFSYNTMVQDAAFDYYTGGINKEDAAHRVSGATPLKKTEFYANSLAGSINYEPFMALKMADSDKKEDSWAKARRPQTLSGYPISEYNNEFYGAEVEYLLYGMKIPQNNVTTADAAIFAIRFIMNCVYAFSNSEIRNTTRTAGLAVQAASCGIIPYQVVMIVLQLALSISESLLDIQVMHTGAKVALVPTSKTWLLSPSNAGSLLKDVAAAKAKKVVTDATTKAIGYISTGIQDFVDCSADEVKEKSGDLIEGLRDASKAKATELMDKAFANVEETLVGELNKLKSLDPTDNIQSALDNAFTMAKNEALESVNQLSDTEYGGQIGPLIKDTISSQLNGILTAAQTAANTRLTNLQATYGVDKAVTYATTLCNDVQRDFSERVTKGIEAISDKVITSVSGLVSSTADKIKDYVKNAGDEAKDKIIKEANNFIDNSVNTITDKMPDSTDLAGLSDTDRAQIVSGDGAASSAISFGYSDYLRVFLFLGLCSSDQAILERLASLIESNMNYPNTRAKAEMSAAGDGAKDKSWYEEVLSKISWFFKKKPAKKADEETPVEDDKWHINKAYTYVKVDAEIEMKMFFLDTDLFSSIINTAYTEAGEDVPDTSLTKSTYHYISVMGY